MGTTSTTSHPAKPRIGIRASAPGELLHLDVSIICLLDGTRVYLHAAIDNYSRRSERSDERISMGSECASRAASAAIADGSSKDTECPNVLMTNLQGSVTTTHDHSGRRKNLGQARNIGRSDPAASEHAEQLWAIIVQRGYENRSGRSRPRALPFSPIGEPS
jgi:hypothetical protein